MPSNKCNTANVPYSHQNIGIKNYQKNFHWDRIQMMNDFMTAQILPNIIFSIFNLDLLKLSGWFNINEDFYNKTQIQYKWGKGLGCDFINNFEQFYQDQLTNKTDNYEKIVQYQNNDQNQYLQKGLNVKKKQKPDQNIISNSYGYENTKLNAFCDRNNFNNFQGGCSYDYSYFATCNQEQYSDGYFYMIPSYNVPENQFDQDLYIDHIHNEQNENELDGQNRNNINQKQKQNQANQLMSMVRCYEAYCNKDKTSITFIIYKKNQKINLICKKDYQVIKDSILFDGQLNCPKISDFCLYASDQSCNADICQQQYNNKIKNNFNEIILGNLKKSFYCKDSKCLSQVSYE
ncbi:hypothetical protein PPERSA_00412 [Pseudocohnilembus persalinus]|uniref:Uncharacterized protein n=1 Tax=Pseudocohnilembus persalinus TaxID=266149 RepID=A0A0V0QY90_PSEPJ|nr:hypothetical protein PPERSA_00412 [Pseudocohnilembus persalinus]|eukprot:KRX07255.1 hypothetical protein PPERSA_00412 [Pseudocohnilembus persalinus]